MISKVLDFDHKKKEKCHFYQLAISQFSRIFCKTIQKIKTVQQSTPIFTYKNYLSNKIYITVVSLT